MNSSKTRKVLSSQRRAFTLIQILATTAIIVLLAGIGFVVYSIVSRRKGAGATAPLDDSAGEPGPGTGGDAVFPEASTEPPTAEPPAENDPR